jgi:hypothetical protein
VDAEFDHLLILKPTTKPTSFFLGAWEQGKQVKSKEDFVKYLDEKISLLNKKRKMLQILLAI